MVSLTYVFVISNLIDITFLPCQLTSLNRELTVGSV